MKKSVFVFIVLLCSTAIATTATITDVMTMQQYPWNGKVVVSYTSEGILEVANQNALIPSFKAIVLDVANSKEYVASASALSGDTSLTDGTHTFTWDLDADGLSALSSNVVFRVVCETVPAMYCVVDVSAGADAVSYPVTYLTEPPNEGFNVDEYKMSKFVLRRIAAGEFLMGGSRNITLTKPFFIGVFETSQSQYQLVMGTNPSAYVGDKRPVENVSYDMIRGASDGSQWPISSAVDSMSFMGKLRTRTGLGLDLPTEAQWEYACRAGTTSKYNNGGNSENDLKQLGRYSGNAADGKGGYSSYHTSVGSYDPNAWGLYDMHGNVSEWCLDWLGESSSTIDPVGATDSYLRVLRGGTWNEDDCPCTSSGAYYPSYESVGHSFDGRFGFRLAICLQSYPYEGILCIGESSEYYDDNTQLITIPAVSSNGVYICTADVGDIIEFQYVDGDWSLYHAMNVESPDAYVLENEQKRVAIVRQASPRNTIATLPPNTAVTPYAFTVDEDGDYALRINDTGGFDDNTGSVRYKVRHIKAVQTTSPPVFFPAGGAFLNASQEVSISCETDGATILYTRDGSDPAINGREYMKPFNVYQSCTVRAIAVKYNWNDSVEATATFTRSESLSEAANLYGYTMETDEVVPWVVDGEVSRDGVSSVRSGVIGNNGTTWLQTSIKKAGTVSFWWKSACEDADEEEGEDGYYDYGVFLVDDVVVARIAGHDGEWHYVSHEVTSGGKHTLKWEYRKDGATSYAPDSVWVDQVQWIPADGSGYTLTTPEPVPYAWLDAYRLGVGTDYETAGNAASGKMQGGRVLQVWQDYVAGTDPTNLTSRFAAKIEMVDGAPIVTWEPDLNTNGVIRTYKVYGKETLDGGGEWQHPTNSLHRFFKVTVEMP